MKILLITCLLLCGSLPLLAQSDSYIATANTTVLTIQQPATGARIISFGSPGTAGASVYCTLASTATVSWNGTNATTTAGSEVKLPGTSNASGATIWTASNVGSGTTGPVYNVPAASTFSLDISNVKLGPTGLPQNLTIATSNSCTITYRYFAQ